jgi:Tfp pilus assembly protein PilF
LASDLHKEAITMPIPRSPTAQVTWIPRQAEDDFAGLLKRKQAFVVPLVGAGGAGKTCLLHRFLSHCKDTEVPVLSLDLTKLQTASALDALLQATTHGTDDYDACRSQLLESYEAMSAILQSYGDHAGQAADLLQKTAGSEESFGTIVDAAIGTVKAAHTFWQRAENKRHRELLRTPEESLLRALARDFRKGGVLLIDTMEQAGHIALQSRLHPRDDGDLVTVLGERTQPVTFLDYLARLAFFLFDKPVLMVLAGRPPALRELGGLPQQHFAATLEVPPFTEPEINDYVRRQLPQLQAPAPEDIRRLREITHGNPFLLERVTRLMAEWRPVWRWEPTQWQPLVDSYRHDNRHGLLLFVTQRLLTHVLPDDTAFWRLALPRQFVHQDMAALLFPPDEFPTCAGEDRLSIYESKGLVYRGQDYAQFFLHDETREALQAWAEHKQVWLDERASALHTALGDRFARAAGWPEKCPTPSATIAQNGNPLLLEAAYHRVMAYTEFEPTHGRTRTEFWQQLSGSLSLSNAEKMIFAIKIAAMSTTEVHNLANVFSEEIDAFSRIFDTSLALDWMRARGSAGTLPPDWVSNPEFLHDAHQALPEEAEFARLLAHFFEITNPSMCETFFLKAIELASDKASYVGSYALYLWKFHDRHNDTEAQYLRAIEANPDHADNLGNYASFLRFVRQRHDDAEALYQRAIEADPKHANNLGNYASFLRFVRQRHDDAEALYQRAIEAGPNNADHLGNYASFLRTVRQRHDNAETLYQRAIEADPKHANNLGNFAQLVLARGERAEGRELLERAFAADAPPMLQLELWFYRYAHFPEDYPEAGERIETLLAEGIRSPGWDLSITLARAMADGHPDPARLESLAAQLAEDVPSDPVPPSELTSPAIG